MTSGSPEPSGSLADVDRVVGAMLAQAHLTPVHRIPELVTRFGAELGLVDAACYLVDLQQTTLVPFLPADDTRELDELDVDATLAGRAFQQLTVHITKPEGGKARAWVALLDGTERLGVLGVTIDESIAAGLAPGARALGYPRESDNPEKPEKPEKPQNPQDPQAPEDSDALRLQRFASVVGELLMTKTLYGDTIVQLRRRAPMGLAAEMQWSLLPPLTFSCEEVTIAAALEPAYEVAGDTVDYAVDAGWARMAVFDSMGHGLRSGQVAAMAVAAYRNSRRAGRSLTATADSIDGALRESFGGTIFATGVVAELDTASGRLRWVNAGHLEPLLIRQGKLVKTLHTPPRIPFGLHIAGRVAGSAAGTGTSGGGLPIDPATEHLEPGDCVVFYTDGVTEARSADGDFFGDQRLADLLLRNLAAGLPPAETMRRVVRSLLDHQQGQLSDDATLLLLQYRGDSAAAYVS